MIFLNAQEFLEEAILSVFAQTWSAWELLLVDDGSSDRSTTIAQDYACRHPGRVRYLEHLGHENRGMSASRNLGLAHARGAYVTFLDADDVYLAERLARHVAILQAQPAVDAVQSSQIQWYSWKGNGEEDHEWPSIGPSSVVITPPAMISILLNAPHAPNIGNLTVRRSAILEIGGFEDSFRDYCEDLVLLAKLYATKYVLFIDDCLMRYRQHTASITSQTGERKRNALSRRARARKAYYDWLRPFLHSRAIEDPSFDAAIERQLRFEDERSHAPALEDPLVKRTFRHVARLVVPESVRIRRRNQLRARQWQRIRAELNELHRACGIEPQFAQAE